MNPRLLRFLGLLLLPAAAPVQAQPAGPPPPRAIRFDHLDGAHWLSEYTISAIVQDQQGFLWAGTSKMLIRYDGYEERVFLHDAADPNSLSHDEVRALQVDLNGTLWVGTYGGGLNRFDPATETFTPYRHDDDDPATLSDDRVFRLHVDRQGTLWVGTAQGLNRFDPATETFTPYRHNDDDPTTLSDDVVSALYEDRNGTLWVGTYGGGLNRLDPASGAFTHYRHDEDDPASLSDDIVWSMYEDRQGMLWVGTGRGIDRFDPATEAFTPYRHDDDDPTSLSNDQVYALHEDRNGTLWVGTWDGGLNRFDPASETFIHYRHDDDPTSLSHDQVTALYEDRHGTLWVGTNGGLNRFDPATETFIHYRHDDDPTSLSHDQVTALYEDRHGTLWVGTESGLDRFDTATASFSHFTITNSDLPGRAVWDLVEDDQGALWISTDLGLARLDPLDRLPSTALRAGSSTGFLRQGSGQAPDAGRLRAFGADDGLGGHFFRGYRTDSGRLYFAASGRGLISFDPSRLHDNPHPPQVVLTGLRVFNETVTSGPESPLRRPLMLTDEVRLAHDQNDLTFDYVGLHFKNPARNRYAVQLVPYEADWREVGSQRSATYPNLPPGTYEFRVKASNADGVWSDGRTPMRVVVAPPWWRTWWAYLAYGLLLVGSVVQVVRSQRRRLVERERARAQARELEQAREIERAYGELALAHEHLKTTQAQLVQQEKLASLGALTAGIAHEIKNPLNFVNNFAEVNEELARELREALAAGEDLTDIVDDLEQNARVIKQHGKRADGIVRAMMQHASGGTGRREATDLNALVSEHIDLAYHGKRAQVPALTVEIARVLDPDAGSVEMVPQEIGRVLLNLLSNAFDAVYARATSENGAYVPEMIVTTRRVDKQVEIRVQDNGVGIPKEARDRIFEPFYTTKPAGSGTGLGLSLSYDIVTQGHGGTLQVESAPGLGATFVITLPGTAPRAPDAAGPA